MTRLEQVIRRAAGSFAAVVPMAVDRRLARVDLSVEADGIDRVDVTDPEDLGRFIRDQVRSVGADVGIGGYGEDRPLYASPIFRREGEEPRTVHLGVDIWVPPGTAVAAPMDGRVHSLQDNDAPLDYGPTVILEHVLDEVPFWTLYGHLARHTLFQLETGTPVPAGFPFAVVGDPSENGGWPPHLHFQLIADIGAFEGDFPGVARRSEAEEWLARCPDPAPMLGWGM